MGRFTALDDPMVDQVVGDHMQRIVSAVVSRMEPLSIILRGSFGRGEGSVMLQDGRLRFLSDYEIDVATFSPFYRSLFSELTRSLSAEFGMETGVRWVRPDYMTTVRIGPFLMKTAQTTISLYESRYGSKTLYGQDLITSSPPVDPDQILLESGVTLLLNRMAESLYYMTPDDNYCDDSFVAYHWINKTILACAESLLLAWKQYHYSYEERGRRFASLAKERLGFMHEQAPVLFELVARATDFKLHPRPGLYQNTVRETWLQVTPVCDAVFRYLVEQFMEIPFPNYAEYPEKFLHHSSSRANRMPWDYVCALKLYGIYRSVHAHRSPRSFFSPFNPSQIVYSVVPLLFLNYGRDDQTILLRTVRQWLVTLGSLKSPSSDTVVEWDYLRHQLTSCWKKFCC